VRRNLLAIVLDLAHLNAEAREVLRVLHLSHAARGRQQRLRWSEGGEEEGEEGRRRRRRVRGKGEGEEEGGGGGGRRRKWRRRWRWRRRRKRCRMKVGVREGACFGFA